MIYCDPKELLKAYFSQSLFVCLKISKNAFKVRTRYGTDFIKAKCINRVSDHPCLEIKKCTWVCYRKEFFYITNITEEVT